MPLPVKDSAVEFAALLANKTLSEAVPLACGVKVTVNDALCPAASVKGNESPLKANSEVTTEQAEERIGRIARAAYDYFEDVATVR